MDAFRQMPLAWQALLQVVDAHSKWLLALFLLLLGLLGVRHQAGDGASAAPAMPGASLGTEAASFRGVGAQASSSAAPATVLAECPASALLCC